MTELISTHKLLDIYKLKNIVRYNNKLTLTKETVSEHSFYVALISLMICQKLKLNNDITLQVLVKSILHDMPEIEINDITHDVKERLKLRPLLKVYELEYFEEHFNEFLQIINADNKIVNLIVDISDAYSVKQYALTELSLGNNTNEILEIWNEISNRITELEKELEDELNEIK